MVSLKKEKPAEKPIRNAQSNRDFILALYDRTLKTLDEAINSGIANTGVGLMAVNILAELLHGGAYAAPMNKRPYFLTNPAASKYYAGEIVTDYADSIASLFAGLVAGNTGTQLANEILIDSNVPHVLPKLLGDEAYARHVFFFSQLASTQLFQQAGTGIKQYTDAATDVIKAVEGVRASEDKSELERLKLNKASLGQTSAVEADVG